MRVGFVYPQKRKCGISIYSVCYAEALRKLPLEVTDIDSEEFSDRCNFNRLVKRFDILHVQYETSFFFKRKKDAFSRLFRVLNKPLIVSLHEVYERDPFVFPRESIKPPFLFIKRIVYDARHPLQTMNRKHLKSQFWADRVLVHHDYQKRILERKGIKPDIVRVIGQPVRRVPSKNDLDAKFSKSVVGLGCAGFINPQFDFDLLIRSLKKLPIDWQFTWVGGIRNSSHQEILTELNNRIRLLGWERKFRITGWLDENQFKAALDGIDLALCLFSNRSTSASMTDLLGSGIPIIATDLAVTREFSRTCKSVELVENDPGAVSRAVEEICKNEARRSQILNDLHRYCDMNSFDRKAENLFRLYQEVLS